jgi:riboflavin biosynthesis pyrimidine reductase
MAGRLPFASVETASYRRLLPDPGETDAHTFVQSLDLRHTETATDRPYTVVNFVASVDGHTTVDEQSRKLSDPGDRDMFRSLRERADAVLVGPATLAAEHYTRMLAHAERRERRLASGRAPEPLLVTITRSGQLPTDIPLFAEPEARVIVFSPTPPGTEHAAATVIHEPLVDLTSALTTLRRNHGVQTLLCEGGPTLFNALVHASLADELFLTLAPRIVGGASGPSVVSGPPTEAPVHVELASVLERDGTLFLRYRFADD